jgi:Tol biopolymer transport system component
MPLVLLAAALGYLFYPASPPPFQNPTFTRLTSIGKVNGAAISPDGKYFAYAQTEAEGQSLWVRQVRESRSIQLMPAEAVEYWGLTFSPDGTQVYATVFTATQADPKLIRVPTLGGAVENLANVSCSGISFSPDGKRFAYVVSSSAAGGTLLRTANADGSDDQLLTIIKHPSFFVYPGPTVAWSPDGRTIACATKVVDESGDHAAIMAVNVSDGQMSRLTTRRFTWVQSLSWLPNGNGLIMTAGEDANSPIQVWHQPLQAGEAKRLSNDLNSYSWTGLTSGGSEIIANQHTLTSSVWVADYPAGINAAKQIGSEIGDYGELGWSPDGRVIYRSQASGKQNLWAMNADGTGQKQLTTDAAPNLSLSVSPDGRYIVFSSFRAGKSNLWRVESDGGNLVQLTNGAGEAYPRITPDGLSVIYQQGVGEVVSHLWKIPIDGGTPIQITKTHSIFPSLSPDGKLVSYFYMDRTRSTKGSWSIGVASVNDGSVVRIFNMPEHIIGRVVRWTPDNSALVYAKDNGNIGNLWKQSLDGGAPVQITHFDKESIKDFAWSQDGKSLAFTRSSEIRDLVLVSSAK